MPTVHRNWLLAALVLLALPLLALLPGPAMGLAQGSDPEAELASLRARVAELEATELLLRQELAMERSGTAALRAERDRLAAALAQVQAQQPPAQPGSGDGGARPAIRLQLGRPEIQVGEEWYALDVPPMLVDGRVMLPVRAVAELLGIQVEWDGATRTVTLTPPQ